MRTYRSHEALTTIISTPWFGSTSLGQRQKIGEKYAGLKIQD